MFDYGVYYPFDFAFFAREGGRPLFREVVVEIGPPHPWREELYMEEKIIHTAEKQIGDTIYIVESAVSSNAKETAYDKLKRLILNDTNSVQIKKVP